MKSIIKLIFQISLIGVIAIITSWQFITNFNQIAQGIDFVKVNSKFYELLTLWGWDLFTGISLIILVLYQYFKNHKKDFVDTSSCK